MYIIGLIYTSMCIIAFLIFVFPIGYLFIHSIESREFITNNNFFVRLPLYLTAGLGGIATILFLIYHLMIEKYLLILVFGLSLFTLFIKKRNEFKQTIRLQLKIKMEQVLPLVLIGISLLHMTRVAHDMGWSPPGDAISHGMFTSLLLYRKKFAWNLQPLSSDFPMTAPPLFYVLASAFSLLIGIYPGKSTLLLSAFIGALFPLILYSIVYYKTKSIFPSLIAFFMTFIIPEGSITNYSVFKEFILGDYTSFFGDLLILLFLYIVLLAEDASTGFYSRRHFIILTLATFFITLSYPYYALYPILYLLLRLLIVFSLNPRDTISVIKKFSKRLYLVLTILASSLLTSYLILYTSYLWNYISLLLSLLKRWAVAHANYGINPIAFLYSNVNGMIVLLAFIISIQELIRKRRHLPIHLFYICVFIPTVLASNSTFFVEFLWMTYPYRSIIFLTLLAYIVFTLFTYSVISKCNFYLRRWVIHLQIFKWKSKFNLCVLVYILFLILLAPMFYAHLTFHPRGWLIRGAILDDDFEILQWIAENIPSDALILNDRSFAGLWLLSFKIKNVVNIRGLENHPTIRERALEANQIFENPENYTLIRSIILKWRIKYIFVSADSTYFDYYITYRYYNRPWSPSDYIHFFDNNPYLVPVVRRGNSGVFRTFLVDPVDEETEQEVNKPSRGL